MKKSWLLLEWQSSFPRINVYIFLEKIRVLFFKKKIYSFISFKSIFIWSQWSDMWQMDFNLHCAQYNVLSRHRHSSDFTAIQFSTWVKAFWQTDITKSSSTPFLLLFYQIHRLSDPRKGQQYTPVCITMMAHVIVNAHLIKKVWILIEACNIIIPTYTCIQSFYILLLISQSMSSCKYTSFLYLHYHSSKHQV